MTSKIISSWIAIAFVLSMLVSGCAGIKPYEPRNYREEGPKRGVFTGAEGEFVIHRRINNCTTDDEAIKNSDEIPYGKSK